MCARLPRSVWSKQITPHLVDDEHVFALSKVMPWLVPELIKDNIIKIVPREWIRYNVLTLQVDGNDITMLESVMRVFKRHGRCGQHIYHPRMYHNDGFTRAVVTELDKNKQNYCTVYHHWRECSMTITIKTFDMESMLDIVTALMKRKVCRKVRVISGPNAIMNDANVIHNNPAVSYIMPISATARAPVRMTLCETVDDEGTLWQSTSTQIIVV